MMRLISQDGTIDIPYDLSVVWIKENYGCSVMANMPNDEYVSLGNYSSREKALKVMGMVQETYREYSLASVSLVGIGNAFLLVNGGGELRELPDIVAKQLKDCACFRFPRDSEV